MACAPTGGGSSSGADAEVMDRLVREFPEEAYETAFVDKLGSQMGSIAATFSRG